MTQESQQVDVVVVGLGPGGESLATQLAKAGLKVVGVDRRLVGGECPYYGCIPSKMVIRAADALQEGRRIPDLGGTSTVEPDWAPVHARIRDEATTDWDDKIAVDRLEDAGVTFVRGPARLTGPATQRSTVGRDDLHRVEGRACSTPAPSRRRRPSTGWRTRRTGPTATRSGPRSIPGSLIVIGGGAIGAELAQAYSRFGVQVTVLEVADRMLAPEEPEASRLVADVFGRQGIQVLAGVTISSVSYDDGHFSVEVDGQTLQADKLLVAAGRRPNLADLGLDTVGLDPSARSLDTDGRMRAATGSGRSATSPARAPSRTCRCTKPRSPRATSSARTAPRRRTPPSRTSPSPTRRSARSG